MVIDSSLFFQMAERMSLIVTVAFLLTRLKVFRRLLRQDAGKKESLILVCIFGLIGIFGTYSAIEIHGALANARVIGPVVAGLLGGPWVGAGAGLISGLHRWSIGGFTGFACALSTVSEGILAGFIYKILRNEKVSWEAGLFTGILAESLQMLIILLVARPYEAALGLVKIISGPMILWNSIGIAIFMIIVRNAQEEEERIAALQTHRALSIANATLKYLKNGLTRETAQPVAEEIRRHISVAAVSLTDTKTVLAHAGDGSDHHHAAEPIYTTVIQNALDQGTSMIAKTKKEIGCSDRRCTLKSAVIVPLFCREQVSGTLILYHKKENSVSPTDLEFARGLARLFSNQLELAMLEQQGKLLRQAELDTLQAQINPHFLFNALNTIISFSRSQPDTARQLLHHLSDFFRRSLLRGKKVITLSEEMQRIDAYLALETARFGDRLKVRKELDPRTLDYPLPALILQPLVENCVKHGILPKEQGGTVTIKTAQKADKIWISVEDDGVGIKNDVLAGLLNQEESFYSGFGLYNVRGRLKAIYGEETGLEIISAPGSGTIFTMELPLKTPLVM